MFEVDVANSDGFIQVFKLGANAECKLLAMQLSNSVSPESDTIDSL